MKILVTGGAGHLGSHVCDLLVEQGHEVACMDVRHCSNIRVESYGPINAMWSVFRESYDAIYHLAANAHIRETTDNPRLASEAGSGLLLRVLESIRLHGSSTKLVFVSSVAVKHAPHLPYAIEKDAGEKYCQHYTRHFGVPTSIIRLNNVYGSPRHKPSSGNLIPCLLDQKRTHGRIIVTGDGSQVRDFIHYTDAVNAIAAAADREGITEIGSCVGRSIREVAELFDCPIDYVPRSDGEVDRQVCEWSDYPVTVNFAETIRELARVA